MGCQNWLCRCHVVLQFFSLISDGLGRVQDHAVFVRTTKTSRKNAIENMYNAHMFFFVKVIKFKAQS